MFTSNLKFLKSALTTPQKTDWFWLVFPSWHRPLICQPYYLTQFPCPRLLVGSMPFCALGLSRLLNFSTYIEGTVREVDDCSGPRCFFLWSALICDFPTKLAASWLPSACNICNHPFFPLILLNPQNLRLWDRRYEHIHCMHQKHWFSSVQFFIQS